MGSFIDILLKMQKLVLLLDDEISVTVTKVFLVIVFIEFLRLAVESLFPFMRVGVPKVPYKMPEYKDKDKNKDKDKDKNKDKDEDSVYYHLILSSKTCTDNQCLYKYRIVKYKNEDEYKNACKDKDPSKDEYKDEDEADAEAEAEVEVEDKDKGTEVL
uniref:Uncharacterized protein n=1 Tax=Colensoa physaloides TaxID=268274 RepID=A0A291F282_9ASTR|nr:hypothetical protein Co_phy1Pt0440 [Colensoa physaloides]ATG26212.1 hypothetical protein Co_phy1Pt0440 [Colensoa physaloides]